MQILVLGMHRSGTSMVARSLNMMGAYFAAEGISTGANQENPKGFWERRDVRTLNDMLLHSAGADWHRVSDFTLEKIPAAALAQFKTDAGKIILDMAAHRRTVLEHFSGTLCVDELHLGRFTLLLATDPLADLPVAFALVDANDQDHMRRFLQNLKNWGLAPKVVVTDGSNLYPAVLGELWSDADHQLCVFHVIKDINKLVLDAVRRMRSAMSRRGKSGRKKKRGRKGAKAKAAAARRGLTLKDKAYFVFKRRHLIVKREENLTDKEREDLALMLSYLPELATLRRFAERIYWLFDTPKDFHQASCRRAAIVHDATFQAVPELAKAMKQLDEERFPKLMAYLANPVSQRVRTNNHVERTNRMFRLLEKVRYKWRRRRTLVRFVVLTLDRIWRERITPRAEGTSQSRATEPRRGTRAGDRPSIRAGPQGRPQPPAPAKVVRCRSR